MLQHQRISLEYCSSLNAKEVKAAADFAYVMPA